ncbi:MAG TPA: DUF3857 domain-containing protein, partial [Bacteroidales bacterium]|nr:DUF3857 domain-containing protein [Bacteroidales bacterium]
QEPIYKTYNWEDSPKLHTISASEKEYSSVILKENQIIEYAYNNDVLTSYILIHKIIKANNDEGIMRNNRIFLPFSDDTRMLVTKARVITSQGAIKELKESDVKVGEDKETKSVYRYFALEGLDAGSEIEYIIVFHQDAEYYGRSQILQSDVFKKNVEFKIISPSNLLFKAKSYNKLPDMLPAVSEDGRNVLSVKMDSIPAAKQELFAVYDPNLMQVVYKLSENKSQDKKEIINYVNAASSISSLIYEPKTKTTEKKIKDLIKKINLGSEKNQAAIIRKVEDYIKQNFSVEENVSDNDKMLDVILEYKNTNNVGITKLFAAIFDELKIEYRVVVTSNRYEKRFDPDFESYNFLDEYMLYFPTIKEYLCPAAFAYRVGFTPYNLFNNYGLFVKQVNVEGMTTGIGEIKFIEPTAFDKTKHNHYVKVDFSKMVDNPTLEYKLVLEGYYAQAIQPYYSFMPQDQHKNIDEFILKNFFAGVTVSDYSIENKGMENFGIKPLIINAKSSSSSMLEKAGNKYLLKIGELIGPQVELYQEEERKFDVENDFNRSYYRELVVTIPDGYKINNLDALKMKVQLLEDDGTPTSYFTSEYEMNKNQIVVKVHEDYKSIYYPKSRFQDYRKVINAAADFNKIVLILEKK